MNTEDIQKLADLSRLHLNDEEVQKYQKDFTGILNYINTLRDVEINQKDMNQQHVNINYLRDDELSYEPGQFSDSLLDQAPRREGDYFKVQKIL